MFVNLLFQRADWLRPGHVKDDSNADTLLAPTMVQRCVACCIQPATASEVQLYLNRSMEVSHSVYVKPCDYKRNDVLVYGTRYLRVLGVRNLIELNRVMVLDCLEYDGADLRG